MKARLLFASVCSSFLLASCGGEEVVFDNPTDDLMSCVQGTWTVHRTGYPGSEFTRTFQPDGTYIEKQVEKAFVYFFTLTTVTLTQGRYDVVDGLLYESRQKVASASGLYEQSVYQDAASRLASTSVTYDGNTLATTTYCGDKFMAPGAKMKISDNPLSYKQVTYRYYIEKDEPGVIHTYDLTLYNDGKADYEHTEFDSDGSLDGGTIYEYEPGSYKYVSDIQGTVLEVRTCGYGLTAEQCYQPNQPKDYFRSYYDRGAALTSKNGGIYYSR